ncbi:MAG: alanine racemase [Gemmataceae bacterium]|nr:alanine racemase [Gemmataceae bacterium]
MNARQEALAQRLHTLRLRMKAACARAGRPTDSVTLVAVTKTVEPEVAADLDAIEAEAVRQNRGVGVLLEVNCSGEDAKQGFEPDQVPGLVDKILGLKQVRVRGLMTMAALSEDPDKARPAFRRLGSVAETLRKALAGSPHTVDELSMGMSGDFEVAIEEGATLIRLGTTLVGDLPNP